MVVQDKDPFSALGVFFLTVFGIESLVSLLGNGFVLAVSGHSWFCSKKMLPCDFLLTTLSLSRFLSQGISTAAQFAYFTSPETVIGTKEKVSFMVSWIYFNSASLWCATWLNVFYCVKVTSFAHPLFSRLKLRIDVLVPKLLGISLLIFIICSIYPVMKSFEEQKRHHLMAYLAENTSQSVTQATNPVVQLHVAFAAISFSISSMASVALLLSLWRHTRNLKKGGLSPKDFSMQAHLRVMKPLLLSLVFYILHFAAIISVLTIVSQHSKLGQLISDIFLFLYPSAHPIILIFSNPKLRKGLNHVLNLRRNAS
ncbi:taste receptor type 2 member 41-like [Paroedura picta]|uniref:taste receptor type 2 member 41-like n=1 Tax=Paroedura picta TaxID=143630 RepID=UPI0010152542